MKLTLRAILALQLLLLALPAGGAELVNGVAALVGNAVITREDVERFTIRARQLLAQQYANQPDIRAQRMMEALAEGLNRLVEQRLILQEFEELKVNIPEAIIEGRVEEEIKDRFGSDRATLAKTLQQEGTTIEEFRRRIRDQIIESAMRVRNVPRDILISPGRIERFYREHQQDFSVSDQVQLSMIVLDKARCPVNPARLAREIIAKLDDGAEFPEMAAVYSDTRARDSGSWGWVDRKVLREDLAEIAFSLSPRQRPEPIDKEEAVYLMWADEVRSAHVKPLESIRGDIERNLVAQERARLERQWLDRLREKSFVRYFWIIPTSRPATAPSEF